MIHVALVEDNAPLRRAIMRGLAGSGISVDSFSQIEPAWFAMQKGGYVAAIIDRRLPDGDGLDLVRHLRAAGIYTPCLLLTGRCALHDRVAGLEAGAGDYLAKPFAMEELVARTRALVRTAKGDTVDWSDEANIDAAQPRAYPSGCNAR